MDDVANQFARELADAIAAAVADNSQVEACREKAHKLGLDMRVTLEAVVGFMNQSDEAAVAKVTTPTQLLSTPTSFELTATDRRFLRSLRIGVSETKETVE
jgi:hypothetical protein